MIKTKIPRLVFIGGLLSLFFISTTALGATPEQAIDTFPRSLDSYNNAQTGILSILHHRIIQEPFNLVANLIFR